MTYQNMCSFILIPVCPVFGCFRAIGIAKNRIGIYQCGDKKVKFSENFIYHKSNLNNFFKKFEAEPWKFKLLNQKEIGYGEDSQDKHIAEVTIVTTPKRDI